MIEEEMRAVIAAHARECGARAEQMMVNNHLYPDEIERWAAEVERLRADAAALAEVIFSLDYALGQWDKHGPPRDYDVAASFRDMRAMIEQARERAAGMGVKAR